MDTNSDFHQVVLELRCLTTTLENLQVQGQIEDQSYRRGSLMVFRAMVLREELKKEFAPEKFEILKDRVEEISQFIDEIIHSPQVFDTYLQ